jgi:hypothetical protein
VPLHAGIGPTDDVGNTEAFAGCGRRMCDQELHSRRWKRNGYELRVGSSVVGAHSRHTSFLKSVKVPQTIQLRSFIQLQLERLAPSHIASAPARLVRKIHGLAALCSMPVYI